MSNELSADPSEIVEYEGWKFVVIAGEPVIADDTLANHIDLPEKDMRALIRRHAETGDIAPIPNPRTVRRFTESGKSRGAVKVDGFLLTQADALFMVTCSKVPRAVAMTKVMIRVFLEVGRKLLAPPPPPPAALALLAAADRGPVDPELRAALDERLTARAVYTRRLLVAVATGYDEDALPVHARWMRPSTLRGALESLERALAWITEAASAADMILRTPEAARAAVGGVLADRLHGRDSAEKRTISQYDFLGALAIFATFDRDAESVDGMLRAADSTRVQYLRDCGPAPDVHSALRVLRAALRIAETRAAENTTSLARPTPL